MKQNARPSPSVPAVKKGSGQRPGRQGARHRDSRERPDGYRPGRPRRGVRPRHARPAGPLCGRGRKGCWETFASTRAALRFYGELAGRPDDSLSPHTLLSLAGDHDPNAIAALSRQAEYLAEGLHAITAALSPEVILFTGDVTAEWKLMGPIIEARLAAQMLVGEAPCLITTTNPEFARLRGAAALVLQRHSGYHRLSPAR